MAITRSGSKTGIRSRFAAALGVAALAATAGAVFATPAAASTNCASGYHCVMWSGLGSAKHSYFNSDTNFAGDTFNEYNVNGAGQGSSVNDNTLSASNSSTGGYESHFYRNSGYNGFLFCVNPGSEVDGLPSSQANLASSLQLRGTTSISCY
ncbi:hypothetical protein ACKI1I_39485 [Streptomyces turgidiscabies]|uniref:Peptidase inhibitor family I36 n=1 Tax=Streptomyces turgidiscabies (strain Car8) TaxID=698760 RepID=L7F3G5_STRT8|nr:MULTISPECIES: hypothetical protein [Streptomyces]ELP65551.1 hypothetical protein STRTUCAR8_04154 [Streptomyces turgidiscabies Car8]MDX3497589.1 hypothetical protein [Streptomyces turgidiscabies]GAQ76119.1 hypothetical protein T45_07908 [Streptomyces turgidiscabies]